MSPMGLIPYMNYQQHQEELLKLAADAHMLEQALNVERPRKNTTSKILDFLGKELSSLGFSVELGFGGQPESQPMMKQRSSPDGCA